MKDYHDLHRLLETKIVNADQVPQIVESVFSQRGTKCHFPIRFSADELTLLQGHWDRHLRSLVKAASLPGTVESVIDKINEWSIASGLSE